MSRRARPAPARIGWAVIAACAAVTSARVWPLRLLPVAIGARGVERRVLGAAYPVVALALATRRRGLAAAAAVFAVVHLVSRVRSRGARSPRPIREDSLRVRLVTANVLCTNPDVARLADDLVAEDADIVMVQEVTPEVLAVLRTSRLWSAYRHHRVAERPGYHGAATFSRFPVVAHEVLDVAGSPMLRTDLATPHGPLLAVNVHTVAPLTLGQARRWQRQMEWLAVLARCAGGAIVMAGDFNATGDHRPFRRMLRGRLRDAFDAVGRGSGATWPIGHRLLPPLLRLDHVVVSDNVEVGALSTATSVGSDHARLVAELGIRNPLRSKGQPSGPFSAV